LKTPEEADESDSDIISTDLSTYRDKSSLTTNANVVKRCMHQHNLIEASKSLIVPWNANPNQIHQSNNVKICN
jgi:hypothetical protein